MAVKISELPAVATPTDNDEFEVNQSGVSRKATRAQIRNGLSLVGHTHTFLQLSDTPGSYSGLSNLFVRVNVTEDGLEAVAVPGGGDMLAATYDPQAKATDAFARANHTGTEPDAAITESSVVQHQAAIVTEAAVLAHEAAIDHDALANFLAGEHVLHTSVVIGGQHSITGGGDISASRNLNLVGDVATPGANKVYGTNSLGARGWKDDPAGGGGAGVPVPDTTPLVEGSADDTKLWRVEVDGFTAGNTRVLTPADRDWAPTVFGEELAEVANAAAGRTKLGLGDLAVENEVSIAQTVVDVTDAAVLDEALHAVLLTSGAQFTEVVVRLRNATNQANSVTVVVPDDVSEGIKFHFLQANDQTGICRVHRGVSSLTYGSPVGDFTVGEIITDDVSGATAKVIADSGTVLSLVNVVGTFGDTNGITGGTSGATGVVSGSITNSTSTINSTAFVDLLGPGSQSALVVEEANGAIYTAWMSGSHDEPQTFEGVKIFEDAVTFESDATVEGTLIAHSQPLVDDEEVASFSFALSHSQQKMVRANHATVAITATVPANATTAFPLGTVINIHQGGAAAVTIAAAGGVTIQKPASKTLVIAEQFGVVSLWKQGTDLWLAFGHLTDA
jgi:hypothetical protein